MLHTSRRRIDRRMASLALVAAVAVTAAGCASGTGEDDTSSAAGSPADVQAAKAVIEKYSKPISTFPEVEAVDGANQLSGKTVWYIPVSSSPPAFQVYADALGEALGRLDIDLQVCDGKFVPTAIAACFQQAGASGADAVVTEAIDYTLARQGIDALVGAGVKVVLGGQAPAEGKKNTSTLAFHDTTDQIDLGQELAANAIIADSDAKAEILYVGTSEVDSLKEAGDHALEYLEEKCGACTVTRLDYTSAALDKVPSAVSAALIKAPKTTYVLAELDTVIPQVVAGARSAGFDDKLKIAGMGADLAVVQGIAKGGPELATSGSLLAYNSWSLADSVVRMLSGEAPADGPVDVPSRLFTQANSTDLTLTPAGYASMDWYGSDDYKDAFASAWGVQ